MSAPPFELGALNATLADPLAGTALTPVTGPGMVLDAA
jgi:hypothetical protein